MPPPRVAIFIDGSNLYHWLKAHGIVSLIKYNYRGLADWLARGRKVVWYRYYVGTVRAESNDQKAQTMRSNQQRLFAHLESKQQSFIVSRGELMKTGNVFHEKGVDVQIAVDLLSGAYENTYDVAILVSSDSDLVPAIRKVRQRKKDVEYVGFANHPTFALQKYASLSQLLLKQDLEKFAVQQPKLIT